MNYKEALEFAESGLYGHFEERDYMKRVLNLFENPQKDLKIIHIAGTNAKGTTGYFLSLLLSSEGNRTGHFSSPHISDYRERIKIDGKMIDKEDFIKACEEVRSKEDLLKQETRWPTYFEMSLLIALIYFRDHAEYLILETGIGGKEDATNQVNNTLLSIITTIGFDHTQMLGSSLEEIAHHKAGIIKEKTPVVSFFHEKNIDDILVREAEKKNSPIFFVNPKEHLEMEEGYSILTFKNKKIRLKAPGLHQGYNANLAIEAFRVVRGRLPEDLSVLEEYALEGRMEILRRSPLLIIDGAHNEEGLKMLSENLKQIPFQKLILILGIMSDKDIRNFSDIVDLSDILILTRLEYERAQKPEKILGQYKNHSVETFYEDSLEKAVNMALEKGEEGDLILCTGSLYLIGAVRDYLKKKN
ncbi:MAG: folylpolyglutamate synthase/dihydrofolate synthase family protein [Gallicola sp.]|nr:folylpolyglutamate synthase/dihydrofolate synthase family protein [Gallicola sp.]